MTSMYVLNRHLPGGSSRFDDLVLRRNTCEEVSSVPVLHMKKSKPRAVKQLVQRVHLPASK